jgi:hypothetical protein
MVATEPFDRPLDELFDWPLDEPLAFPSLEPFDVTPEPSSGADDESPGSR